MKLLVPGAKLLGAAAVGQEAAEPPRGVVAAANSLRHLVDNFVEQVVGVDEQEPALVADQIADKLAGVPETDQGLVGVDDGHGVARAVGVDLEVVGGDAAAQMAVRAQELLDNNRVYSHCFALPE